MKSCGACSDPVPEAARFCPSCGAKIQTGPGEPIRKLVTILFSDVVGSTALAERMDPEALGQIMMAYFSEMNEILRRHGGAVEKYIGDAVLAVFGFPAVHEDDALRACRAALEMQEALSRLNERFEAKWGARLETRTGVNTGEVVATSPTRDQTLPLGDPANVAARLESVAPPGEIYIGESTWRLVRHAVEAEHLEPLELKGKAGSVRAWRLVRLLAAPPTGLPPHVETPFVGRDAELALLTAWFDERVRERSCGLATVMGDPGIGKSRLVLEFLTRVDGSALVLRSRSLSYGEGITFWPLGEILKQAADIGELDDPHEAIAALDLMLSSRDDAKQVVRPLASAVGWLETPYPIEEVFRAARVALEHLAGRTPVLVLFEDVHWAEQRFLDLLEYVAKYTSGVPLLLLCTARPDLIEGRPTWETAVPGHTVIRLHPLSTENAGLLAAGLLDVPDLPQDLYNSLGRTAEGNPLFIEQLIAAWLEQGLLVRANGLWTVTADPGSVTVPPSLRSLLQSRVDRLPSDHRSLLERAAVMGQIFQRAGLLELADADADTVDAGLESLAARGFIDPSSEPSTPEPSYRFHHVLLRDAAYEGALKSRRAALHERFGAWLRVSVEHRLAEYEEIVGYHFEQAYLHLSELGPPDEHADSVAREAFGHLATSGRRALARSDARAATSLLERAVALTKPGPARTELLVDLGAAAHLAGELQRAEAVLNEAMQSAEAAGDARTRTHADVLLLYMRIVTDPTLDIEDARRRGRHAVDVFEAAGDHLGLARTWLLLAGTEWMRLLAGPYQEALENAIVHARRAGARREETDGLYLLAPPVSHGLIPADDGLRIVNEIRQRAGGDQRVESSVLYTEGRLLAMRGRFEEARLATARCVAILEELGNRYGAEVTRGSNVGYIENLAGDLAAAERGLWQACGTLEELGETGQLSTLAAELAIVLCKRRRFEEAEPLIETSRSATADADLLSQAKWRAARALVLAGRGRTGEAVDMAREGIGFLEGTDFIDTRADSIVELAGILAEAGRPDESAAALEEALALYERKGNVVSSERVRRTLDASTG